MKRCVCALLAALLLCGLALAEGGLPDELPQLQPVTFPEGITYTPPENGKNNFEPHEDAYSEDDMSYHDDSLDVRIHRIRAYDTDVVLAFVQIATPEQLRTELAKKYPSNATMRMTEIGKRVKAIVAVNGDWFTYHNSGIVYRNGELLRNREDPESDGLAIDINGDFHIVRPMTKEAYAQLEVPVKESFAFGPALVMDGEVLEIVNRKVTYKQRVAIGQVAPLSYVLVATDGPDQKGSVGLSVPQLAELMHALGAHTAYNLDGGQSSAMQFHKIKINAAPRVMRAIGDIIYFTTAIP